jgi:hypothetical protein
MFDETLKLLLQNISNLKSIGIVLLCLVGLNTITAISKIIVEIVLAKRKELVVNRKTALMTREIQIEEELYTELAKLRLIDNQNQVQFLEEIEKVARYISMYDVKRKCTNVNGEFL